MSDRYAPVGDFIRSTVNLQLSIEPAEPWMADGLCTGFDGDMWYADPGRRDLVVTAKAICGMCPVQTDCLEFALRTKEAWGVWGGMTPTERARMVKPAAERDLNCRFCGDPFQAPNGNYRYCERHRTNNDRAIVAKRKTAA